MSKKNILTVIFEFLVELFRAKSAAKTTEDVINETKAAATEQNVELKDRLKNSGEVIVNGMAEAAVNEAATQAGVLLLNHGDYLLGLTEAQREYALRIAVLKSVKDLDALTFDELKEYRQTASKALELGIEVADEMNTFWKDFCEAVKSVIDVAADVGVKAAATALKIMIPIL